MSEQQQTLGFWNNGLIGLGILFVIPALLVVGGFFVIALNGRPAGGVDETCERVVDGLRFRTETYSYTAGLTDYQQQTLSVSVDGEEWQLIFDDVVQAPDGTACNEAIVITAFDDGSFLAWHRKNVALTINGDSWQVHNVCDEPRRDTGRCDSDEYDFVAAQFVEAQAGTVAIQRFVVDEYGQRVSADGGLRVADAYTLTTDNGGMTWELLGDAAAS